jgi:hypothetical protein
LGDRAKATPSDRFKVLVADWEATKRRDQVALKDVEVVKEARVMHKKLGPGIVAYSRRIMALAVS